MTTYHGNSGVIKIGSTAIAEVKKFSLATSVDKASDDVQGDSWKTHLTGKKGWSGSIEGKYYPGDTTGQALLVEGASVSLELQPIGTTSGLQNFTGTATIDSISIDSADDDVVSFSCPFEGNGALTRGTVGS